MNTKKRGSSYFIGFIILLSSIVFFLDTQSANATTTLRLKNGTTIIDIEDNSIRDLDDAADIILFNGAVGAYTTNISTGIKAGTLTMPELDLVSVDAISSSSGGKLEIWLSDIGFGPYPSPGAFNMSTGGTQRNGGTVSFSGYIDNGNTLFDESTLLGTQGPWAYTGTLLNSSFGGDTSGPVSSVSNPYSLTLKATVDYTGAGRTSFNSTLAVVPEPVSSTLFIAGGIALGFRRFWKKISL